MKFSLAAMVMMAAAVPAHAVTLLHQYTFSNGATDSAGSANGTLFGDAHVGGGVLFLDGDGDYVQFSQFLVPTQVSPTVGASYSVYARVAGPAQGLAEIISQGTSTGGPGGYGFYYGTDGASMRLTDQFGEPGPPVLFKADGQFHDYLLTSGTAGTDFYVDGTSVFHSDDQSRPTATGGATRLGRQFPGYDEYFTGRIDTIRIFNDAVTPAQAAAAAVPEAATWAMMISGFGLMGAGMRRRRESVAFRRA